MEAFVYIWVDRGTGKQYIGVHKGSPEDGYVCSSKPMMREYKQRPIDFQRQIIDIGTWGDMLVREQALIVEHNAVKDPMYYNQAQGLGPYHANHIGTIRSAETKAKMSTILKGHKRCLGSHRNAETKARMSAAQKKRTTTPSWMTPETRAKISAALKGKTRGPYRKRCKAIIVQKWTLGTSEIRIRSWS